MKKRLYRAGGNTGTSDKDYWTTPVAMGWWLGLGGSTEGGQKEIDGL